MSIKDKLKKNFFTKGLYSFLKNIRDKKNYRNNFKFTGKFVDRSNGANKLLVVLAGYKEFAYPAVFGRIKAFLPKDIDVCIISSGIFSPTLDKLCEENHWSYLSTKQNNVCLVQNAAINLHPNAKLIFKLDEDIFITENYFQNMCAAYEHATMGEYIPGVIAPMIPINGFAHMLILEKLGLKQLYSEKFETVKYMAGAVRKIEHDPEVAKFFWGKNGYVPTIDEMNARFSQEKRQETPSPIRFSIGAILFRRSLWEEMGYFHVVRGGSQLGDDEVQLCCYCCMASKPVMISENIVVGHLSFGKQNVAMKEYYLENQTLFEISKQKNQGYSC